MATLIVEDMQGNQAPLIVTALHITQQLNTLEQIDFTTANTSDNIDAFNMIQPRSLFINPQTNEMYRLSQSQGSENGDLYQLQVTALQVLTDLSDHYVNGTLNNTQSLDSCMRLITNGTKFSYSLHGNFDNHDFGSSDNNNETFGNGLAYDLFINSVVKDFNLEWTAHDYHIDLYNKVGSDNQFVCLDKDDIYALQDSMDVTTLKTRISGTGKVDDNSKKPAVTATYTSPNAKQFGIIDAPPYSDDRCTDYNTLVNELKQQLQDYPLVQYQANVNKFKQYAQGLNNNYAIGNYGIIRTRWGIDETVRISKIDKYVDSPSNADVLTFGNLQLDPSEIMAQLQNSHDNYINVINEIKNSNSSSVIPITPNSITIKTIGKATGTITLINNNNVITVSLDLSNAIVETIAKLDKTYVPNVDRSGTLTVTSGLLNYKITKDGTFMITKITNLTGKALTSLDNASGSFTYIV